MTSYLQTRTDRPLPVTVRDAGQDSSLSKSSTDFWLDNRHPSLHGYMDKICTDFTGSLESLYSENSSGTCIVDTQSLVRQIPLCVCSTYRRGEKSETLEHLKVQEPDKGNPQLILIV